MKKRNSAKNVCRSVSSPGGRIAEEKLLAELQRVANRLDGTPSMREMEIHGAYSPSTYQSRFGSWNDAICQAGLTPNSRHRPKYSNAELLSDIQTLANSLDRTPTREDMRERGTHSPSTYLERFGSWQTAVKEAGLTPRTRGVKVSEDELLRALSELAESLDRIPTSTEMAEQGRFSPSTYRRRFGSWNEAIERAGLSETFDKSTPRRFSDQEMRDELRRMAGVLGRSPTSTEMDELGEYSAATYRRRFGSWVNALADAGLCQDSLKRSDSARIDERTLLDELRHLATELEHSPTAEEMWKRGSHSPKTYLDRYGTWNAALEAAGLETRHSRRDGIEDRELILGLRRLAKILGHVPQRKEMEEQGPFSGMTYYNHFGSWQNAVDVAGFDAGTERNEPTIRAHCNVCCRALSRPLARIEANGKITCGSECRAVCGEATIRFDTDVLGRTESRDDTFSRLAALIDSDTISVPDVLLYLRHSIDIVRSGFNSAVHGNHYVTVNGDLIEVKSQDSPRRFLVQIDSVDELGDRIETVQRRSITSFDGTNPTEDDHANATNG
ncbi:homing endonuclease associated repeat-containing protein [Haladaptatus sp. SPP-AMP-3]|uniref:homing endonuclease associated repeat-containing protein n=1 Tax=Haladaptatus sp. SPP-AMP-3 TaxID=3121295 RepID=UPI003C2E78A3